jgi:hypothetical protein
VCLSWEVAGGYKLRNQYTREPLQQLLTASSTAIVPGIQGSACSPGLREWRQPINVEIASGWLRECRQSTPSWRHTPIENCVLLF